VVPSPATRPRPKPPLVTDRLERAEDPLADDVAWSGVTAGAEASFSGAAADCEVVGSRLQGVRLTGAVLERLRLIDVELDDCELSGVLLEDASFVRVRFTRCRLSGIVAAGLKAHDVSFADCRLDGANFRMAEWERSEWTGCDLTDGDCYAAKLGGCAFLACTLTRFELSKAVCRDLALHGSTLDGIRGADALGGCLIGPDQVVPLGIALVGALGIRVQDHPDRQDEA
jgi:uncharacterized protein YjbI with pentapeptide repeats